METLHMSCPEKV